MSEAKTAPQSEKETARLEAFSDGVFAIAITLLVLELKVPDFEGEPSSSALFARLWAQWPSYFALITSFFTILIMWVHHHTILRLAHKTDSLLLFANGFLLLLVSIVPFPTAVLAKYLRTPGAPAACTLYGGVFFGISIAFYLLVMAAFREPVLSPHASHALVARVRNGYRWGPPLYLTAFGAAPYYPWAAMAICTGLWIFWAAMTRSVCIDDAE